VVSFEPGAAYVDQIYLFIFQGVLGKTRCGQENK
jgi:hypothetical protein